MIPRGGLAVMAQRKSPPDAFDFFPTPPWATRALCEALAMESPLEVESCWEPACGEGHMARPLAEYFPVVHATDVHDYGYGGIRDFLFMEASGQYDWIITNPPFALAQQFAQQMIKHARVGCAILVRTAFLESVRRYHFFKAHPPSMILQFSERVPMHRGRLDPEGVTATAYCWIVWRKASHFPTQFLWIPPCRKRLEKASDYDDLAGITSRKRGA